ncbi:hypothetical protein, partial [Endozoicomonas sp. ONNA2]|uniref:hypothetical protein n=1 Tax=Endozoicomonas sp. ONNA2 TaxID=2828741 RepID=UPI002148E2F6
ATEAAQDAVAVSAIADKFGNVDQAISEATEQADRATIMADEAKGHSQSADAANTSAVNAKEEAKTAANEAKAARDEAVAIVHNDEGSVVPTAGSYPVADAKGHLDIGWTPLLQAMYPYSGVIGSVDKEDLFNFYYEGGGLTSNKFEFKDEISFNINGRLVTFGRWRKVTLSEAESTADRAIAFDDVFIDWNGNFYSHRSITPHRTNTGYDRDAIATEHGYTKVQTGLYKTGDTYALLLGRVARRNQGAYHPVFNPEGSTSYVDVSETWAGGDWHSTVAAGAINSTLDCFKFVTSIEGNAGKPWGLGGSIQAEAQSTKYVSNPDRKPYDAIYADDFTPLYYSAKNVVDRQALLFDSFNRAIAGETFSGAEGTYKYFELDSADAGGDRDSVIWLNSNLPKTFRAGVPVFGKSIDGSITFLGISLYHETSGGTRIKLDRSVTREGNKYVVFALSNPARPQFLMVDIIGSLDAMPDEWKTHGIPGNWLSVGEEGESLIPDGTSKNYKLSRKCLKCYQALKTRDKGTTWVDATGVTKPNFESAANSHAGAIGTEECYMIFYRTSANPFELADNSVVTCLTNTALAANTFYAKPSVLNSWLSGKIPTESTSTRYSSLSLKYAGIIDNQKLSSAGHVVPITHDPITLPIGSPFTKIGSYLTGNYMQCFYKEVKHNGESWGDDNKFNIVDKQSTVTDLNGETVIVGQKRVELPYHSDGVQY